MALVQSPDETMLVESVTALLARSAPVAAFRALRDQGGDARFRRELWDEMAAVGLPTVAADFGIAGAALVMEAVGRHLAASPLASAIVAADLLAGAGQAEPGPANIIAIAINEDTALIARARDIGALLAAAELHGITLECFERTVEYLKTREQFGVLIGTFQALQHRAARLWIDLQLASAVLMKAARAFDAGDSDASQQISHAKLRLCETARKAIDEAVQMHGGIGVTDDLDISLFMKRARVLSELYGNADSHRERLAAERFGLA